MAQASPALDTRNHMDVTVRVGAKADTKALCEILKACGEDLEQRNNRVHGKTFLEGKQFFFPQLTWNLRVLLGDWQRCIEELLIRRHNARVENYEKLPPMVRCLRKSHPKHVSTYDQLPEKEKLKYSECVSILCEILDVNGSESCHNTLVAEVPGPIAGVVGFVYVEKTHGKRQRKHEAIMQLFVHPEYQQRHIGTRLVEAAERYFMQKGKFETSQKVFVRTLRNNAGFWERCGYDVSDVVYCERCLYERRVEEHDEYDDLFYSEECCFSPCRNYFEAFFTAKKKLLPPHPEEEFLQTRAGDVELKQIQTPFDERGAKLEIPNAAALSQDVDASEREDIKYMLLDWLNGEDVA
eukprot:m.234366 g.234366  ORF g.234366 m.234366 type:complete len:353 (+) comp19320_c0_seq1:55-1113(+)